MFYGWDKTKSSNVYHEYRNLIKSLTLSADDYIQLKKAFAGGFTHANALYVGDIVNNVYSFDFTSSYPYVMLSEKFPMSTPKEVVINSKDEFNNYLKHFACIFDIKFYDLKSKFKFENYISKSHCSILRGAVENNGRIVSASELKTTITEQDYFIIRRYYKCKKYEISNFRIMIKAYLPTNFVKTILEYYVNKTELKDVKGREVDYAQAKERINSLYGMCVTDICRDKIEYSPLEWTKTNPDIEKAINKENGSLKRFLYYPWGVWVTAYARFNLFTAITELKEDYIYSDTDSVKFINYEKHKDYFEKYNNSVVLKLKRSMKHHNIDFNLTRPKNNKGEVKQIGIWDDEKPCTKFKTLGAKRYMVEKNGEIKITVAGLNKEVARTYLLNKYGNKVFDAFNDELYIPKGCTGKQTHTYIDDEKSGILVDYLGNKDNYYEKSAIHLEDADYTLSLSELFIKYLMGVEDDYD